MKTFIGRIAKDATVNTTKKTGKDVVNFTIIENHRYTTKEGDRREEKNAYQCAYWRSTGIAEYLTKGTLVQVEGHLNADAYTDKEGNVKPNLRVHAVEIVLLAKPNAKKQTAKTNEPEEVTEPVDDLPF